MKIFFCWDGGYISGARLMSFRWDSIDDVKSVKFVILKYEFGKVKKMRAQKVITTSQGI